jgi:leishmanolysin-like peptidase
MIGTAASAKPPHIVFVLVDDWGFADVSFRNPHLKTPNFQTLADNGLILNRHYVFKYCSPTRASFLTGRWPHHVHQWNTTPPGNVGTNINMTMLPAKLKKAGYMTHMVGKWHQGLYDPAYLPVNRGFDTSSGFLQAGEGHFNQTIGCAVDFWKNHGPDTRNGTYDAYIYEKDLTEIFDSHDPNDPLFLYLPLHNVHAPMEAPKEWIDIYSQGSTCEDRRVLQAMVSVADNVTGHVVELLKAKGMWDNTIFVVSADNGGADCKGSNYPLKGSKHTFFEGGVRVVAFASGGLLPESRRGKSTDGFIHVADWYTTFCNLAGVDPRDNGDGLFPVDGTDVWPILTGVNEQTLHDEIVLGYDFDYSPKHTHQGALIAGKYKLIVGPQETHCDSLMWSPLNYPCQDGDMSSDCSPHCLYDIIADPSERDDLSKKNPQLLQEMMDRYNKYSKEPRSMQDQGYHSEDDLPKNHQVCKYLIANGGYWRPWINV